MCIQQQVLNFQIPLLMCGQEYHGEYYLRYGPSLIPASIPDIFQHTWEKIGEAGGGLRDLASMHLKVQSVCSFVFNLSNVRIKI